MKNKRFFSLMRQYAELENVTSRDFSDQLRQISYDRVIALENEGVSPADALAEVQTALTNQKLRFPITLEPLVG